MRVLGGSKRRGGVMSFYISSKKNEKKSINIFKKTKGTQMTRRRRRQGKNAFGRLEKKHISRMIVMCMVTDRLGKRMKTGNQTSLQIQKSGASSQQHNGAALQRPLLSTSLIFLLRSKKSGKRMGYEVSYRIIDPENFL